MEKILNHSYTIKDLINPTISKVLEFLKKDVHDITFYEDPIEKEEISAHYGASHAAVAFIVYGKINNEPGLYNVGVDLLRSILNRWTENVVLPSFHHDFNNFALCLALEYIDDINFQNKIKKIVCLTKDSNHDTVNWIPMRWYVNENRYRWTNDKKYRHICEACRIKIESAINSDGGIEDRLPKGTSFNLQYDISCVAELQFLNNIGINVDLSKELGFLLNAVLPDGDINYQGRGCNQIFAWGPWIYLLASSGRISELSKALHFLGSGKLQTMLNNDSLMLNDYAGSIKYLWWDYHYSSVYIAHFLLWLVLADRDYNTKPIKPNFVQNCSTGFHIKKSEEYFISWFDGSKEYLAEYGPNVCAIWTRKHGIIFKGSLGPWQGLFGNTNTFEDIVIKNFFGPIKLNRNYDYTKNGVIHKLFKRFYFSSASLKETPIFTNVEVTADDHNIQIMWDINSKIVSIFNVPLFSLVEGITLYHDDQKTNLVNVGGINNQYGFCYLFQSHCETTHIWKLIIPYK